MIKRWLLSVFGPTSKFEIGDGVQLIDGGQELMVVADIVRGWRPDGPYILCRWIDAKTSENREVLFPETDLEPFDWYHPQKPRSSASWVEQFGIRDLSEGVTEPRADGIPVTEMMPAMEGIDIRNGLAHMGGNAKLYQELLLKFSQNHEHFVDEWRTKSESGQTVDAQRMIHTLKGVSGSLGMMHLHELSIQLEKRMCVEPVRNLSREVMPLSEELGRVLDSIRKKVKPPIHKTVEVAAYQVLPQLLELEKALMNCNPGAKAQLREIGRIQGYESEMESMEKAMAEYEFNKVLTLLRDVKAQIGDMKFNQVK